MNGLVSKHALLIVQFELLEGLRGHTDKVKSVCFSPDGTKIASGSSDKTIKIWNPQDGGAKPQTLDGHIVLLVH